MEHCRFLELGISLFASGKEENPISRMDMQQNDPETPEPFEMLKGDRGNLDEHDAELYQSFASRDEEWHDHMTKQLLKKVDTRLLPILIMMYLLNFLDRT